MEEWKDIEWYEWLYQVSNMWNIKSLNYNKTKKERILVLAKEKWYLLVGLNKKWYKRYFVHRLVWLAFILNIC